LENTVLSEQFMRRALELATLGSGAVSPNPLVGCVLVVNEQIIGEGWHQRYGQAHAEVNAIRDAESRGNASLLPQATAYVTLEPCSHVGKTPPCADLLIEKKIKKVIVCNTDPNPLVSGRGIEKLTAAQIVVEVGLLEKEGRWLNRRFFTGIEKKRPYIILKWAETADGLIGKNDGSPLLISNEVSRTLVHKMRSVEDAIMVGTNTAAHDNPRLNVRLWAGRDPVRVVIDQHLRLLPTLNLFDQTQKTLIYNGLRTELVGQNHFIQIDFNLDWINTILNNLLKHNIYSMVVEGGTQLLNSYIHQSLFDEIWVFKSTQRGKVGVSAPHLPPSLRLLTHMKLLNDQFLQYIPSQLSTGSTHD
jgi:diaminohydroxyphosphoribosylaminopyrimidine deaminase / 5-amino-6-(5-phosphoribosylamino)uracil reductase